MMLLEFISFDNGIVRYWYQPEEKGKKGIVEYNTRTEEGKIIEAAENNPDFWNSRAIAKLRRLSAEKQYPEKTIMAIY
ncbi:hypothetical protein [Candidatus Clostridium stratigraminis]|uniref:Uncharacterized protein n=1 Tax=Candidatus Clostridium stratigraminis TaxID=3381661 RepID=A0ABW8SYI8_9CLOT